MLDEQRDQYLANVHTSWRVYQIYHDYQLVVASMHSVLAQSSYTDLHFLLFLYHKLAVITHKLDDMSLDEDIINFDELTVDSSVSPMHPFFYLSWWCKKVIEYWFSLRTFFEKNMQLFLHLLLWLALWKFWCNYHFF